METLPTKVGLCLFPFVKPSGLNKTNSKKIASTTANVQTDPVFEESEEP